MQAMTNDCRLHIVQKIIDQAGELTFSFSLYQDLCLDITAWIMDRNTAWNNIISTNFK